MQSWLVAREDLCRFSCLASYRNLPSHILFSFNKLSVNSFSILSMRSARRSDFCGLERQFSRYLTGLIPCHLHTWLCYSYLFVSSE